MLNKISIHYFYYVVSLICNSNYWLYISKTKGKSIKNNFLRLI